MKVLTRKLDYTKTQKNYKQIVWFYDLWGKLTESKAAYKVLELADIQDGNIVLEIACGTGVMFEQVVKQNPTGNNVGIDLSPDMLKKARKRLEQAKGSFELKEGNVLNLKFNDNSFDILINNFMVDLMPEDTFDTIAKEFYRILKPGGHLVVSTFSFGQKKIHGFWLWTAKHFPSLLTGCRPVSFTEYLKDAGFSIENDLEISQNTFPSEVIKARKSLN